MLIWLENGEWKQLGSQHDEKSRYAEIKMKITSIGIGTRGDVQPLVELGVEMKRRGHDYRVASFEDFKPMIEEKGLEYIHLDGSAAKLTQYLITEYVKVSDFMPGYEKLYNEFPGILDQIAEAVKGSDVATCENDFSGRTGRCFAFQRLRQGYILSRQCALWLAV